MITEYLPAELFSVIRFTVVRIVKMSPLKAAVFKQSVIWYVCLSKVKYRTGHYSSSPTSILYSQMLIFFPVNICSEIIYHFSSI